jgi:hypothetical protein
MHSVVFRHSSVIRMMINRMFVLASILETDQLAMTMGVKSDKTFEEIVERLAALFTLQPRPGDKNYEESIDADPVLPASAEPPPSPRSPRPTK